MVIAVAYYSGGYQFDAREKPIFDSRITRLLDKKPLDNNLQ